MSFAGLLTPDLRVGGLADIPLDRLWQQGIVALLVDLDNTLIPYDSFRIPDATFAFVEKGKGMGFRLCIVSNSIFKESRVGTTARQLGIPYVAAAWKPRRRGLRSALQLLQAAPAQAALIGDQLFTDVLAGRRLGLYTVLVEKLTEKEFPFTRYVTRNAERLALGLLEARKDGG